MRQQLETQRLTLIEHINQLIVKIKYHQGLHPELTQKEFKLELLEQIVSALEGKYADKITQLDELEQTKLTKAIKMIQGSFTQFDKEHLTQLESLIKEQLKMQITDPKAFIKVHFILPKVDSVYKADTIIQNHLAHLEQSQKNAKQLISKKFAGTTEQRNQYLATLREKYEETRGLLGQRIKDIQKTQGIHENVCEELQLTNDQLVEHIKQLAHLEEKEHSRIFKQALDSIPAPAKLNFKGRVTDLAAEYQQEIAAIQAIKQTINHHRQKAMDIIMSLAEKEQEKLSGEKVYFEFHHDQLTNPEYELELTTKQKVVLSTLSTKYQAVIEKTDDNKKLYKELKAINEKAEALIIELKNSGSIEDVKETNAVIAKIIEKRDQAKAAHANDEALETLNAEWPEELHGDFCQLQALLGDHNEIKQLDEIANPFVAAHLKKKYDSLAALVNQQHKVFIDHERIYALSGERDLRVLAYARSSLERGAKFYNNDSRSTLIDLIKRDLPFAKIDAFMAQETLANNFATLYTTSEDQIHNTCILNIVEHTHHIDLLKAILTVINRVFLERDLTDPFILLSILNNEKLTELLTKTDRPEQINSVLKAILQRHPQYEQAYTRMYDFQFTGVNQLAELATSNAIFLSQQNRPELIDLLCQANATQNDTLNTRANQAEKMCQLVAKYQSNSEIRLSLHKFLMNEALPIILKEKTDKIPELLCKRAEATFTHRDWGKRLIADFFNIFLGGFLVRLLLGKTALFSTAPTNREAAIKELAKSPEFKSAAAA